MSFNGIPDGPLEPARVELVFHQVIMPRGVHRFQGHLLVIGIAGDDDRKLRSFGAESKKHYPGRLRQALKDP